MEDAIIKLVKNKELYGGAIIILFGTIAVWEGFQYGIGTLTNLAPGFFPLCVGVLLAIVGTLIVLSGCLEVKGDSEGIFDFDGEFEWKGWACIILGIIAFIFVGHYGGLVPASFLIVFISALGDRENKMKSALIFAVFMTIICVVVFRYALGLQFPLFQWG